MATKKQTEKLDELIENLANAYAEKGERKKAGALRELNQEMKMPEIQAIKRQILKDGITPQETMDLLLAIIVNGL